jgi:hypothetical protein
MPYFRTALIAATLTVGSAANAMDLSTTDIFAMVEAKLADDKIISYIRCNRGDYETDPTTFVYRYYNKGKPLAPNITDAMKQANARNAINGPLPSDCPIVRTKMARWNSDIPFSNKMVLHGPPPVGATVDEARPLKYVYVSSSDSNWKARSAEILKAHGKFEVVETPQEAELFVQVIPEAGRTKYDSKEIFGSGVSYINWKAAQMTVRWYKADPANPENVESRIAYYRFQKGGNALEASFKHFLNAVDGPRPKGEAKAKK